MLTEKYNLGSKQLKLSLPANDEQIILILSKSESRLEIKGEFAAKRKTFEVLKEELQKLGKVTELEEY